MNIIEKLKTRTLSEEFHSRSPNSQAIIKCWTVTTPTSKSKIKYTNMDKYNDPVTSIEEKQFMEMYGLVQINKMKTSPLYTTPLCDTNVVKIGSN